MNIYIVMDSDTNELLSAHWTQVAAQEEMEQKWDRRFTSVEIPSLSELVSSYFRHRKLVDPDATQALLFLMSEVGELSDAAVNRIKNWVRNNDHDDDSIADEIGDVLMMLIKTAEKLEVDPLEAMLSKWHRKGWPGK